MESITIDGLGEEDFRRSIESMLRHGEADAAAKRLRALLAPCAGEGNILPPGFLAVSSADIVVAGWEGLAEAIARHDRSGRPITALSVTVSGQSLPEQPAPAIETCYFSDEAYPFSGATRPALLCGYSQFGSEWQQRCEGSDTALSLEGIDELYQSVRRLEASLLSSDMPSAQDISAGTLGACYLAVLIHQAVRDAALHQGLPRPLCVMAASGGAYPFFDAPVLSWDECLQAGAAPEEAAGGPASSRAAAAGLADDFDEADEEEEELAERDHHFGSLLGLGASMRKRKPVILVDAAEAAADSHHEHAGADPSVSYSRIGELPAVDAEPMPLAAKDWAEAEFPDELAPAPAWCDDGIEREHASPSVHPVPEPEPEPEREPEPDPGADPEIYPAGLQKAPQPEPQPYGDAQTQATIAPVRAGTATSHSLRRRVVRHPQPRATFIERAWALLRHAYDRIRSTR